MAIESSIIFSIGSKSVGGFTELKSAIDLLGQAYSKVQEVTKELDKFSQMWQKTNQAAVLAADSAAGGLVDTGKVLQGYNKLIAGGVKITEEQFKTMTARAAEFAQATGGDATDEFNKMVDAITRGTTTALRPYGVNLKRNSDLTKSQSDAIKALTEGHEGLNVKAQTSSERMYALNNNLGTLAGLMYDAVGASGAFGGELDTLNGALGEFNTWLAESPETMASFMLSLDGMGQAAKEAGRVIIETLAGPFLWIERKLNELGGVSGAGVLQQAIDDMMKTGEGEQAMLDRQFVARGKEKEARAAAGIGTGGGMGRRGGRSGAGVGKGGGGKGASPEEQRQQELDEFFEEPSTDIVSSLTNDELSARIDLNREYTTTIEEQEEAKKVADEAAMERLLEEEELKRQMQEEEIERVGRLKDAWTDALQNVDTGSRGANKALKILDKAVIGSISLSSKAGKASAGAVIETVAEVGGAISQEATWQGFIEIAKAIAAAAEQNYIGAAAHGAASVAFFAAAAKTGKGGGGGGATKESAAVRQSERFAGPTGASDFGGKDGGGGGGVTVSIQMKEGAGGFFDAVVEENDRASMDGRRSFQGM